jgi:tripartite-type tricarboxylate transporter receptor subunit TctC
MHLRNCLAAACLAAGLMSISGHDASSQSARTIKIIVPSGAGGGADVLARLLADHIGKMERQTIVVENRPGAGNTIGTEAVARAEPDGNTLLISTPEFVINPHLRKLNYDPLTSFEPICYLVRSPQLLVVNSASPYRTLADLLNAARSKPGELSVASAGPASSPHIVIETLKRAANANVTYVPYQGSAPAVNAVLGGHVTAVLASYPNVAEQVRTGKLKALASASAARIEQMPDVPTLAESGFKEIEADIWFGVAAPAKTPKESVSQLVRWFSASLQAPEIKPKLADQGMFAAGLCGGDFDAFVRKQHEAYGHAIREAGIKAN